MRRHILFNKLVRKAYDKKHCMEVLGFSKKTWLKYFKHAKNRNLPKESGHPLRIAPEKAEEVAQKLIENAHKEATPSHEVVSLMICFNRQLMSLI